MGELFGKADPPKPETPARMPDVDDPAVIAARRRRANEVRRRSGRAGTVLTDFMPAPAAAAPAMQTKLGGNG